MPGKNSEPPLDQFGVIVISAFCLMCVAGAIWTSGLIFPKLIHVAHLGNSVEVPAQILDIDRETVTSGDGTKTVIYVTYRYEFEGVSHQHRTRTLTAFATNRNIVPVLDKARETGEPVICHVDPDNPERNLLSKEFSIYLLLLSLAFPLGFAVVALLVARGLWSKVRHGR